MINCHYTVINERLSFNRIVEEKHNPGKALLEGALSRIALCYQQYLDHFDTLETKMNSSFGATEPDLKQALKLCYKSQTSSTQIFFGTIFRSQPIALKLFCPYCMLNKPTTLDHYIGKAEFPEYAVLRRNLIPCCYNCNQKKGESWREHNQRRYIHFYNDRFLHHRFLYAQLNYGGGGVPLIQFSLSRPPLMPQREFDIIGSHFNDLDLLDIYAKRSNETVSSVIESMQDAIRDLGADRHSMVANLEATARTEARRYGVNYWSSVLHEAMSTNATLIASL